MDNQVTTKSSASAKSFIRVVYKNLLLIVLSIILGALVGFGIGIIREKPIYTEGVSVMLLAEVDASSESSSRPQDMALSQYLLGDVKDLLTAPEFTKLATARYHDYYGQTEEVVKSSGISVSYAKGDSLIFNISYSDSSSELAEKKLKAVVDEAKIYLQDKLVAGSVELKETTNVNFKNMKYEYVSYIGIGLFVGLLIAFIYVVMKYLLDNTVKDKEEIEELTGSNILACINLLHEDSSNKKR